MKVSVDRKSIDQTIANMNLFPEIKNAIAAYHAEENKLIEREQYLNKEMDSLQQQHTKLLLEKNNTFEVSDRIYLQRQLKEVNNEVSVISSMLEELQEEKTALKLTYAPLFVVAIEADHRHNAGKYNANEIVDQLRYEMIKAIADLSNAMQGQYYEVAPIVLEVFNDAGVKASFPRIENKFPSHHAKPGYGEAAPTVIAPNDIRYAIDNKQVPQWIKRPAGDSK